MKNSVAKKILIFSLMVLGVFFVLSWANAQGLGLDSNFGTQSGLASGSLSLIVAKIINAALGLLGLVLIVIIMYAGFLWMTAGGEADKVAKAKRILVEAVIGLLIIACSYAISSFILYTLTFGTGTNNNSNNTNCVGCACDNSCPPLTTPCVNPSADISAPYICSVSAKVKIGNLLTIKGSNFGSTQDYDPATYKVIIIKDNDPLKKEYQATIVVCASTGQAGWDNTIIKALVPATLSFDATGSNGYKVYVEKKVGDQPLRSINNQLNLTTLRNAFTLLNGTPDPGIICIDPPQAAGGVSITVNGKHFGATQAEKKLVFYSNSEATINSWSDEKITSAVPNSAVSGDVIITFTNDQNQSDQSDGEPFLVLCGANNTCGSTCCQQIPAFGAQGCNLAQYCGAVGIGAKCNGGAACIATDPACILGLTCDSVKCTCREPKAGDSCGVASDCLNDVVTCGTELVCGKDCKCQEAPQITAVAPDNGAPGNYITIFGKGFGNLKTTSIYKQGFETSTVPLPPTPVNWGGNAYPQTKLNLTADQSYSGKNSLLLHQNPNITSGGASTVVGAWLIANFSPALVSELKLEVDSKYLVRAKYKGNLESALFLSIENHNVSAETLATVPAGLYKDWQTAEGIFTYKPIYASAGVKALWIALKMGPNNTTAKGTDLYIDDFEIFKVEDLGQVYFSDNKLAPFPYETNTFCPPSLVWQDNQILVAVPQDAVNGSIKVVTKNLLSAQTNATNLPPTGDFSVNTVSRPGLCSVSPPEAEYDPTKYILLTGQNLKPIPSLENGVASIGGQNFAPRGWWYSNYVAYLSVPNLKPANYPVQVKVGAEYSNPINFKVLAAANAPIISSIDPEQGPTGQYITISGSNFGNQAGTVKFWKTGESATLTTNWQAGDNNFPQACASTYWSNTQIIIKVPNNAASNAGSLAVITSGNIQSNIVNFNHCAQNTSGCPLTPGICAIAPNKAPAGRSNVIIYGDNFKNYDGTNSKVVFFNGQTADASGFNDTTWTNNQIGVVKSGTIEGPVKVPQTATTGSLYVQDSSGTLSNKVLFEVADCRNNTGICTDVALPCCQRTGECEAVSTCTPAGNSCTYKYTFKTTTRAQVLAAPQVVETQMCNAAINQSPSPWKNSSDACVNAKIYARFDQAMNLDTLRDPDTLIARNIIVNACTAEKSGCNTTVALKPIITSSDVLLNDAFSVSPQSDFIKNIWYQVTLSKNIKSAQGLALVGNKDGNPDGNYVWYFKTRDSDNACPMETVSVGPNLAYLYTLSETQVYNAYARAKNCNMLSGGFTWNWYLVGNAAIAELSAITKLIENVVTVIPDQQLATPLSQGTVKVAAKVETKADEENILNINLHIPVIESFTPKDGLINDQVNSYVTISGYNFGATQSTSKVYFEKATCSTGEISPCWTEAKVANCAEAWTDTSVKVIVPKDVKDGAWIRVVTSFGEDNTDFNNNKTQSSDEIFSKSQNIYPFLCQLNPDTGSEGISVTAIGDNFGDKNTTTYKDNTYGVGSFLNFATATPFTLANNKIKSWSNTAITYFNPLKDLDLPVVNVSVSINPYTEPNNGSNDFADLNDNKKFDEAPALTSNAVPFYQPPLITRLSPNNGPQEQWFTIIGKNFGSEEGEIWFGGTEIDLAPCEIGSWTDNYIIALVPRGLDLGDYNVHIKTQAGEGIVSNDKTFTLNKNPLGAGLCALVDDSGEIKTNGNAKENIGAEGVRFGEEKLDSNLMFTANLPAVIDPNVAWGNIFQSWGDTLITTKIPDGTQTGDVAVIKKVVIGQKCAGFSIGSWCSTGKYDDIFQQVTSNGLPLTINVNTNLLCGNGMIDPGEQCDKTGTTPPYVFADGETCDKYSPPALPNCILKCDDICQTLVCDANGNDCKPVNTLLCGNGVINGVCSNGAIISKEICINSPKYTWNGSACSNPNFTDQPTCEAEKNTWIGEQCDGNSFEYDEICAKYNAPLGCVKKCGADCKTIIPPYVESTLPVNGQSENDSVAFCRNGVVDIYFSKEIDPLTITQDNFSLGSCSGGPLVKAENKNLLAKAFDYVKNIFNKLIGRNRTALAVDVTCNPALFAKEDYSVSYANIIDTAGNKKTVVSLELTQDIFKAAKWFNVGISDQVKDLAGNNLDLVNSPQTLKYGVIAFSGYAFGFKTADSPNGGICDVDRLDINVYHSDYTDEALRSYEAKQEDLFRCAGKNDCALPLIAAASNDPADAIPADYDQDRKTSGNQHIYKAIATSSANTGGFHLSVNYRWSRSDASDPANMLSLVNKLEDTNTDNNIVQNKSGVAYVTAAATPEKENTSLLIAEAQARGSAEEPYYKIFKVEYLGCAYPWRFVDDYGNSKTWYCRDAGKSGDTTDDLPEAGTISDTTCAQDQHLEGGACISNIGASCTSPNSLAVTAFNIWNYNSAGYICTALTCKANAHTNWPTCVCDGGYTQDGGICQPNGVCGTNAKTYLATDTSYSGTFCAAGTAPSSPAFPSAGSSTTWSCNGTGGGTNATCTASRAAALSSAKAITAFSFASPPAAGVITGTAIAVTVPCGTDVTDLSPTIGISTGASVNPASGAHDFTSPVTYTVTAADGSTQTYVVTVTVAGFICGSDHMDFNGECVTIGFYGATSGNYTIVGSYRAHAATPSDSWHDIGTTTNIQKVSATLPAGTYDFKLERTDTLGGNVNVVLKLTGSGRPQLGGTVLNAPTSITQTVSGCDNSAWMISPFQGQGDGVIFNPQTVP